MTRVYLTLNALGAFLLDKESNIVAKQMAYPDIEVAASNLISIRRGKPTDLLKAMTNGIPRDNDTIVVVETRWLKKALQDETDLQVEVDEVSSPIKWFRATGEKELIEQNLVESEEESIHFRKEVAVHIARDRIRAATERRDLLVKQAIDSVDEIDPAINEMDMRLREWYSLHFPTLVERIEDSKTLATIISEIGLKGKITPENLDKFGLSQKKVEAISASRTKDTGADIRPEDAEIISELAGSLVRLINLRENLQEYVEKTMTEVAPNMSTLVDPLIAARLLSHAGSLKELASKPSSTVQVYGAEKALFRSLKTGANPPKHGIIYRVPEIHTAPYWQRGNISRALAGKLSIAARVDAYSKRNIGAKLRAQFEEKIAEIQQKYPEPPDRAEKDKGGK
ncbi:MAG: C/D box methylation guide ribonucleoprotein complex aNOP56 subunit [Candidatus Thorarchaeota archaeon]|nr:C/D box methylation guide ribonucleoprotein complex aNOP56 subunit [Candidatus Thorarchaeota archaeon]